MMDVSKQLTVEFSICHVGQKVCVCVFEWADLIEVLLIMALGSTVNRDLPLVAVAAEQH